MFLKDKVNELSERMEEFDGLIVGYPVYYAGPTSQVCCFLARFFFRMGINWKEN